MRILLIEDETKTANAIKQWLEDNGIFVDLASNGMEGFGLASHNPYDVIVSDLLLPGLTGLEICQKLRENSINTPVLLLSALSSTEDKVLGLDAGADDYLGKPFDFSELLARINALLRRSQKLNNLALKLNYGEVELNLETYEVFRAGTKIALTQKEFCLLEFFVRNHGRVLTKTEILKEVWGLDVEINTNVIEVYVNYLRNKIDKGFGHKLIHTQFGIGYIFKS